MRKHESVCLSFIGPKKAYDRVNREALWQVLRMYDVRVNVRVELRVSILKVQLVSE